LLELKATNVLDKKYILNETSAGLKYNQPRAGWFATVTYRM